MSLESELHDLLEETAGRFEPDPAVLADAERRAGSMLRARRWRWGVAAAAAVALIATVGTALGRGPAPEPPVIIDQPSPDATPEPTETQGPGATGEVGPELTLASDGSIRGLANAPDRGVLVQVDDRVVLVGIDGTVLGHLQGQLAGPQPGELAEEVIMPGQRSVAHLPAVTVNGTGDVWLNPVDAVWQPASGEAPLLSGGRVVYDVDEPPGQRMQLYGAGPGPDLEVIATWPEGESWWLSADHRLVTWRTCWDDRECPNGFYDSDMGGPGELDPGCWIANALGDFSYTEICDGTVVATSFGPDRAEYPVPLGTDGQRAIAVAAFDGGIVRVDHASCDVVEPMQIEDGEGLVPLLGRDAASNPSAVPLGTVPDGRVVLHYNAAACDATSRDPAPGVYLFDPGTGEHALVYEATVPPDRVQAWDPFSPVTPTADALASQDPQEAERDGVLPAVAALAFHQRVQVREHSAGAAPTRIGTEEGVWVVSRMPRDARGLDVVGGCGLGATDDPDALYRRDVICTSEYGEVLLLDHDEQRILRAFPLPGVPPRRIAVTDDAVWCGRTGDGALPDSMLCRIDRQTYDWQVRIFPSRTDSAFRDQGDAGSGVDPATGELWLPSHWTVDSGDVRYDPSYLAESWSFEGDVLNAVNQGGLRYDPETLEPLPPCDLDIDTQAARDGDSILLTTTIRAPSGRCGFDPNIGYTLLDGNGWPLELDDRTAGETQPVIEPGQPLHLTARWSNWCGGERSPATVVFRAGPFGQHQDPLEATPACQDAEEPSTILASTQR